MRYIYIVILGLILLPCSVQAQKTAYIPAYLLDITTVDGAQFTWDKTAQSDNFTLIWGNTVGTTPATYADPDLAFDPAIILDTLEAIYATYKTLGFAQDTPGTNLHQYKIPVVMVNTWGPAGATGWASGGDADGVIGAFWVHPLAMHGGHVAAHELTHSLQAQCVIDYRTVHGLGGVWDYAGIFWETHANFMRDLVYPTDVTANGMDVSHIEAWGDWKNTYENYALLMAIMETDGIGMVNRMWRESYSYEYPLQTYKRLLNADQAHFNDVMYLYARRMAAYDFTHNNVGSYFRSYRTADLNSWLPSVQNTWTILKPVGGIAGRYEVPVEQAPEEYGYNIIPLYPDADSCSVIVKFKGHMEANAHCGWRYGFVTTHPDGTVSRYSNTFADYAAEVAFSFTGDENKMYLVVMGAPADRITTDTSNDTWHGYPKHFRFPYELTISGAVPEGMQDAGQFRQQLKLAGHLHINGGGWVDDAATVANTVYVAPTAMVLGASVLTGDVRIDNTAMVNNATMSGAVSVSGNALVNGGTYSDSAQIKGQSYSENNTMWEHAVTDMRARVSNYHLYGNIEVGGDVVVYNDTGACNNGVYYRMTNYYQDNLLECDGRTASHPANADVNNTYSNFTDAQMALHCNCALMPGCLTTVAGTTHAPLSMQVMPNPATTQLTIGFNGYTEETVICFYNTVGQLVKKEVLNGKELTTNVANLPQGIYFIKATQHGSIIGTTKLTIVR